MISNIKNAIHRDIPVETVSSSDNPVMADDGSSAKAVVVQEQSYLPGPGVGLSWNASHNSLLAWL